MADQGQKHTNPSNMTQETFDNRCDAVLANEATGLAPAGLTTPGQTNSLCDLSAMAEDIQTPEGRKHRKHKER